MATIDLIGDLKQRARVLHRRAQSGDVDALARLARVPELAALEASERARSVLRRHCLAALAVQLGFQGWPHASAVLRGDHVDDLGTLMHREYGGAYWNIWSASYEEAHAIRADHGGFLLGYRRQFLIVEPYYIEALGLDPEDPDWERIGRDWARPRDREAWVRITAMAIDRCLAAV